ncbi:LysR family transcriptional regulator [Lysobacter sp. SG-8]|uniref:LysR family transcriptional regulator n=1 Tax=Marilutibacter penaei TaxID=2759900 RepID=A0A7W3U621_9GAMM|nr:LysR substrate-binding domain-containing protein [Lysobacter penaei]MBB1089548.1 LysR family transcriptional regulator [Lysobacter penaei]
MSNESRAPGFGARQLRVFCAVAREGGVRRAAEVLHLSQSAVSASLAELERQLGAPLFDRVGRGLQLNGDGRALLPRAEDVLSRIADIQHAFDPEGPALAGELRVGASNTVGNYMVADLLGSFVRAHPAVRLRLEVDNTAAISAALARFALDVGVVEGPTHRPELVEHRWRRDCLVVCAPQGHVLAGRRLSPDDLQGERWVLREAGSASREQFEQVAAGALGPIDVAIELGQNEAVKQAVLAGLGLACLPGVALRGAAGEGLVVLETPFLDLERWLSVAVHRDKHRDRVLTAFLEGLGVAPPR